MADARFQMFTVFPARGQWDSCVVWRFLSANNRTLAQPVKCHPNEVACLVSLRELRSGLTGATVLPGRDDRGLWSWRLRVGEVDLAVSSRTYLRRIRAYEAGESFRRHAAEAGDVEPVRLVSANGFRIESC
ncbi:hypothetical protein [Amycolatopsis anabasis]|uniref:hypothetical protein n=1 Tax=Amycolatopsis anabasis TaxID=1840409 RepID=UPI001C55130C|nr:hypothetical protein [Amycolatopsis anabasis]